MLVSKVNPSRGLVEHMFKPMFLCLLRTQDVILRNPSGRVTSRTYVYRVSSSGHVKS